MDIIIIPFHDCKKWIKEGFRTRDAHLVEHFSKDPRVNRIIVINRPVSYAEIILKKRNWMTSALSKREQILKSGRDYRIGVLKNNIFFLDICLPEFFKVIKERKKWWYSAFNNKRTIEIVNMALRELQILDGVLLLQNPMAVGVIDHIQYSNLAFDAIDNWLYHPQMKSNYKILESNYQLIDDKADIIFTVSEDLTKLFQHNCNVNWAPNGVDIDFFAKASDGMENNKIITIGYVGKIQDRVDFELVEKCIQNNPHFHFLFIGPVYSKKNIIRYIMSKYNNIEFIGDVHYSKLPEYLKNISVAIIPHKVDKFTNSMNPLKVYEYLAAGKPVVTTEIAGVNNISKYVFIANKNEFSKKINEIAQKVQSGSITEEKVISSVPYSCTWEHLTQEMLDKIEELHIE